MKLDFCPTCGTELKALDDTHYKCTNGHDYFNNPRAATAIILVNDKDELLFAKRAHNPQKGKYDFPGGFVDFGETAEMGAKRELQEELGVEPQRLELITTLSNHYDELTTTVDCIYICRSWLNEIRPADDVASVTWQPISFIESSEFAWPEGYQDLPQILDNYLQNNQPL